MPSHAEGKEAWKKDRVGRFSSGGEILPDSSGLMLRGRIEGFEFFPESFAVDAEDLGGT
jgi:hypothetical protein